MKYKVNGYYEMWQQEHLLRFTLPPLVLTRTGSKGISQPAMLRLLAKPCTPGELKFCSDNIQITNRVKYWM